jgi:hypothetical protein
MKILHDIIFALLVRYKNWIRGRKKGRERKKERKKERKRKKEREKVFCVFGVKLCQNLSTYRASRNQGVLLKDCLVPCALVQ